MKRTTMDWSEHQLEIIENDHVIIHTLKIPNTVRTQITFINCKGVMTVTGDFGNWVFCREFHPSPSGAVSGSYWDEKLEIHSVQKSETYNSNDTELALKEWVNDLKYQKWVELNDTEGVEPSDDDLDEIELEDEDWFENLIDNVDDEITYIYTAYRETPSWVDVESIPFVKSRRNRLNIIYDAFDEICQRLKTL